MKQIVLGLIILVSSNVYAENNSTNLDRNEEKTRISASTDEELSREIQKKTDRFKDLNQSKNKIEKMLQKYNNTEESCLEEKLDFVAKEACLELIATDIKESLNIKIKKLKSDVD